MMECGGKSSFNLGLDSKIARCLLMMRPTSGKFGLNVVTNGNNFFLDLPRVLRQNCYFYLKQFTMFFIKTFSFVFMVSKQISIDQC